MFIYQRILLINGFSLLLFCVVALVGDSLCFGHPWKSLVVSNKYVRALIDSLTHGLVSALATSFLFGWSKLSLILVAFILGSLIDIDHFIQIGSFSFHRVLNSQLNTRPFLHNSFYLLILTIFVFLLGHYFQRREETTIYSMIFFTAWTTHHLRDAQRRGLTFLPFGETSKIDHYIPLTCFLLLLVKFVQIFYFSPQKIRNSAFVV